MWIDIYTRLITHSLPTQSPPKKEKKNSNLMKRNKPLRIGARNYVSHRAERHTRKHYRFPAANFQAALLCSSLAQPHGLLKAVYILGRRGCLDRSWCRHRLLYERGGSGEQDTVAWYEEKLVSWGRAVFVNAVRLLLLLGSWNSRRQELVGHLVSAKYAPASNDSVASIHCCRCCCLADFHLLAFTYMTGLLLSGLGCMPPPLNFNTGVWWPRA